MSPPVKAILLILAGLSQRLAIKPPHPPPTEGDRRIVRKTLFEKSHRTIAMFLQVSPNPETVRKC
ncbi:hypothetical protein JB92DRAFT_1704592 [Gautieria morchelliformis]|nr:hypothetical protein JB92DRAFT_1704592 [Gautieria morchelliformis]